MNDNKTQINSEEAKVALESIKQLEKTSLKHAMPSTWFGIAISIVVGILVFLIGAGLRDYYFLPIIALPLLFAIQRSKMKVTPRPSTTSKKTIIALVSLIAVMFALIFSAIYVHALYDNMIGPIICGLIATLIVYWLSVSERNEHQKKIDLDIN
jgi:membrane-anchored glycerophosphoryl diester phosphodiesterase (GDPDase)